MTVTSFPVPATPATFGVPPAPDPFPSEERQAILGRIDEALATGELTMGRLGRELEERFAARHGAPHAVAVSSGTAALDIGLRTLDVAGREVLVPANASISTAAAVLAAGGRPRFVDCDPETLTADVASVRAAIGPATAGMIVVHVGGLVAPVMTDLLTLGIRHGLFVVEDAAHAPGARLDGQAAGTFGMAAAFSFSPSSGLPGGEGGILLTNSDRIADEARTARRLGGSWRMSEAHAAIALSPLARLDQSIAHRRRIAARYDRALGELPLRPRKIPGNAWCTYHSYVAFLPDGIDRAWVKHQLRSEHGVVLPAEVYERSLHRQPVFAPWAAGDRPGADEGCGAHICLPISGDFPEDHVDVVVDALASTLARA